MPIYRSQLPNGSIAKERETGTNSQLVFVPVPDHDLAIFVGESGKLSTVEDFVDSRFVTLLQDVPDAQHGHSEKLLLRYEKDSSLGIEYSLASGGDYGNISGPHLFIDPFVYGDSPEYEASPRPLGSENFDICQFESTEFPLNNNTIYLSGIASRKVDGLPYDAFANAPYVVLMSFVQPGKVDLGLFYWSTKEKCWKRSLMKNINPPLIENSKVVACTNSDLLGVVTPLFETARNGEALRQAATYEILTTSDHKGNITVNKAGQHKKVLINDLGKRYAGESTKKKLAGSERIGLGTVSIDYFKRIPKLMMSGDFSEGIPRNIDRLLKSSLLDAQSVTGIFEEIASWPEYDPRKVETLLDIVVPNLLSVSSLNREETHKKSLDMTLWTLARQVGLGRANIMTPLCPPYTYTQRPNGLLTHYSGELQPDVGMRFGHSLKSIREVFDPLREHGVNVNLSVLTYTGDTGRVEHLVDLGEDVLTHYREREEQIFERLQRTRGTMEESAKRVLRDEYGFKIVSIEVSMGDKIARLVTDFTARFGDKVNMYDGVTQAEVGNWLGKTIGVGEGWLLDFVEQETGYREDKAGLIDPKIAEGVTINALREGLLYMYLTQYAKRQGFIILDMETTSNYMMGSLRHYPAPCIMGNSFDPNNPISRRNIRQPFNLPVKAN